MALKSLFTRLWNLLQKERGPAALCTCGYPYQTISVWQETSLAKAGYRGRNGGSKDAGGLFPVSDKRREEWGELGGKALYAGTQGGGHSSPGPQRKKSCYSKGGKNYSSAVLPCTRAKTPRDQTNPCTLDHNLPALPWVLKSDEVAPSQSDA